MDQNHRPVNDDGDVIEIDILELFGAVLQKIWVVILSALLLGTATYLVCSFLIIPKYRSTTKIYVINRQNSDSLTYSDLQTGTQLTKDYQELVTSRPVLEEVMAELGLDIENDKFKKTITVSVPTDTRIVSITAEDTDPYMARAIADSVRNSAAEHIANVMNTEAVNVVEEANLPTEIYSPKIIRNTVIGAALGAFIAIVFIVIIYIMDDTIKNPDDVEKYLNLSVLGTIPVLDEELISSSGKGKKKKKVPTHSHIVMTETLSDASKLMREAKAMEFAEPKEPQEVEKDLADEVFRAANSDVDHNRRGVRRSE
ncbi:MAG: protein-tyrosine kinase [Lachnospiraceae bacterium]|nr:protein-tyrosine kinase [Lachnospiraceae bacterium]